MCSRLDILLAMRLTVAREAFRIVVVSCPELESYCPMWRSSEPHTFLQQSNDEDDR